MRFARLIPLAVGGIAVATLCFGGRLAAGPAIGPGTYLILSRTLRTREADGHGIARCAVAAYRWKLGSSEEPVRIGSVETPDDCYDGYGVENGRLYRTDSAEKRRMFLDLSGRVISEAAWPTTVTTSTTIVAGDVRIETFADDTISSQGNAVRVYARDGRLLKEKPTPGLGIDAVNTDGTAIYFSQRADFTDGFSGPWPFIRYDWENDRMEHLADVERSVPEDRAFDPAGKKLLYVVSRMVPDVDTDGAQHGWKATTPSELHLLDLDGGKDALLRTASDGEPFSHPRFSPDGTRYLIRTPGADTLYDLTPGGAPLDSLMPYVADWFDETVVLDPPDSEYPELMVHDLRTKTDSVPSKDFAPFDYVGRVDAR